MHSLDTQAKNRAELRPGQKIAGYRIEKKIGEGAMAILYLVTDKQGRQFSLKVPRQILGVDPVSLVAFENELRLAPYLDDLACAYMPKVISHGKQSLLLMDFIDGVDLWAHLNRNGCLTEDEAVSLIKKVVEAVKQIHERRIIHLDLKLSNVMVTKNGDIRLIDFGLANHLDLPDLIHESFNEPKGTPAYIAPEQFIGIRDDFRSDIFSLGVMLFEMTTNKLPYNEGTTPRDVMNRIKKEITLPRKYNSNLSESFNYFVGTCLYANPDMRFSDTAHMSEMLGMWEGSVAVDKIFGLGKKTAKTEKKKNSVTSLLKPAYHKIKHLFDFTPNNYQRLKQWAEYRKKVRSVQTYRILVAIKLDNNMQLTPFNIEILQEACFLAKLRNAAITIISAIETDAGMASGENEVKENNILCNKARKAITSLVNESIKHKQAIGVNVQIGSPIEAIEHCIENYHADLLVIGIRKKSSVLGNKSGNRILSYIKCNTYLIHEGMTKASKNRHPDTEKDFINENFNTGSSHP